MSFHPTEDVEFMNMCMVCDGTKVLALDKVSSNYSGTTFPGGHVEPGELFADAMVREIFEETGLTIKSPVLKLIDSDVVSEVFMEYDESGNLVEILK